MVQKITWILILIISFLVINSSCFRGDHNIVSVENIEEFALKTTEKYDSIDFKKFSNLEIRFRERGLLRDAITVSSIVYENNLESPDSWYCSLSKYRLISAVSLSSEDVGYKKYLSTDSLKSIITDFSKLNLDYLKVDKDYNVFLSPPPFSFERAFLLKVNDSIRANNNKKIRIEGNGTFIHFTGNWYLSNFYIDKHNVIIE